MIPSTGAGPAGRATMAPDFLTGKALDENIQSPLQRQPDNLREQIFQLIQTALTTWNLAMPKTMMTDISAKRPVEA